MRKRIIIATIILLLLIVGYNYIYQDHRNISKEVAKFTTTSLEISNEFTNDPTTTETKYLNKTLIINGLITEISKDYVTLEDAIVCVFKGEVPKSLEKGITANIKGRCVGYDDLLQQVKLDQCNIIR